MSERSTSEVRPAPRRLESSDNTKLIQLFCLTIAFVIIIQLDEK